MHFSRGGENFSRRASPLLVTGLVSIRAYIDTAVHLDFELFYSTLYKNTISGT